MDEFDAIDQHFAAYAAQLMQDPAARFAALRKCSFFEPMPDDWLQRMAQAAQIKTFKSDVSITTQDDEMKAFYVILYGSADAYRNGKIVGRIETGDCFGEGIFFADGNITTSATVIADDKIIAAEFSKRMVEEMHADPAAMISMNKALLLALFKKLKAANHKIEKLMLV
ncbi:cyclic nucleotide-binding domain-containing protein [Caenimonas koreensis]|uniref:cyclic nucleotide-binding domain-containing protein n=1 Tax=Caenimonas koreensis TaxID=367474 RepID=UPI0037840665